MHHLSKDRPTNEREDEGTSARRKSQERKDPQQFEWIIQPKN